MSTQRTNYFDENNGPKGLRRKLFAKFAVILGSIIILFTLYYIMVLSKHITTDNAYVGANIAQVTPLVSAPVKDVLVDDTQAVKKGDILVTLDNTDATLFLKEAEARYQTSLANFNKAKIDLERREALSNTGSVSGDELTAAKNAYNTTKAELDAAEATRDKAQVDLDRTIIKAPIDGIISKRQVQIGQHVNTGMPLMIIVPIDDVYVDANFKEVQLSKVKAGQEAILTSDLYGDSIEYHGVVEGFSGGTGAAFALIPAQNATGNWIKVVQRLPVRIKLDKSELEKHPLRVGLSMEVDVNISK